MCYLRCERIFLFSLWLLLTLWDYKFLYLRRHVIKCCCKHLWFLYIQEKSPVQLILLFIFKLFIFIYQIVFRLYLAKATFLFQKVIDNLIFTHHRIVNNLLQKPLQVFHPNHHSFVFDTFLLQCWILWRYWWHH